MNDAAENPALDPDWESPAATTLGKKVLEKDPQRGYIRASFEAGEGFVNRGGRIFGGFLSAMLDGLCGHAVRLTHEVPGTPQVTLELKTKGRLSERVGFGIAANRSPSLKANSATSAVKWSRRPARHSRSGNKAEGGCADSILRNDPSGANQGSGWVAEWFKAPVLKTGVGSRPPWVRIPPLPPFFPHKILILLNDLLVFQTCLSN